MNAYFNRFQLSMTLRQAQFASHNGPCDENVASLIVHPSIRRQLVKIGPAYIAAELREYGAWDDKDLADWEENKKRIVWCAAGDIVEVWAKGRKGNA